MTNMATLYHKNPCRRGLEIYHFVRPSLAHYICKDHGGVFPAISILSLRKWTQQMNAGLRVLGSPFFLWPSPFFFWRQDHDKKYSFCSFWGKIKTFVHYIIITFHNSEILIFYPIITGWSFIKCHNKLYHVLCHSFLLFSGIAVSFFIIKAHETIRCNSAKYR